ncbi:MAG: ABC transporter permease [Clostridia bacterium]|nr:ABC transporter permease [Clostridia bacterium]
MTNEFFDEKKYGHISADKLEFANEGVKLTDKKFSDKPIGYFKDAWIRFCKNKASIVALCIIILIFLFSIITPLLETRYDSTFMDTYYQRRPPILQWAYNLGIDGTQEREFTDKALVTAYAIGLGAYNVDDINTAGDKPVSASISDTIDGFKFQPIRKVTKRFTKKDSSTKQDTTLYKAKIDRYLEVGFLYMDIEQGEYNRILNWQKETGRQVLYPLVAENDFNYDKLIGSPKSANYWYKTDAKGYPVKTATDGSMRRISLTNHDGVVDTSISLEDNYLRDSDGKLVFYKHIGGGSMETSLFRIRVLYYNYYLYQNGFEPNYILGTDSQGYDLALRLAEGIQLSIFISVFVCLINFIIGALYGAVEGYYGGAIDIIMERISDILVDVPFIVVATLFQMHLAKKVGPLVSLIFAFVLTGWIGIASRVRSQFYRFKNQEYVMAARTLGASDARIIWKHIFPNTLGTIITASALAIPGFIFSESMLSFLGIVKLGGAGKTSLGTLLSDASAIWMNYPHLMIFPALVISLLMISFNLFGNGLRDAFNPSLRGTE